MLLTLKADASRKAASAQRIGVAGGLISASANGARFARTTAPSERRGIISPTIRRAAAPIAGARTASPASPTTVSSCACRSLCGTGSDPILKERLFGLTNSEGNHGEDVKELYYYLDAVPSYAYARMLYKLPQAAYPYEWLVKENARRRGTPAMEFELIDTGIFDEDRYFDVEVEYAKADQDDVLMRVTVHNRGPDPAQIHVLPQAWFRNVWSWSSGTTKPSLREEGNGVVLAHHEKLGAYAIQFQSPDRLLFCENETNFPRLFGVGAPHGPYKDAFHEYVVHGGSQAVSAVGAGTKVAALYARTIASGGALTIRVRLRSDGERGDAFLGFDETFSQRIAEADSFYAARQKDVADEDMRRIQRQAFAGMLWNKQFYYFDVEQWLDGDPLQPPPPESRKNGPQLRVAARPCR